MSTQNRPRELDFLGEIFVDCWLITVFMVEGLTALKKKFFILIKIIAGLYVV